MPGRIMDQHVPISAQDLKKDRSQVQEVIPPVSPPEDLLSVSPLPNGGLKRRASVAGLNGVTTDLNSLQSHAANGVTNGVWSKMESLGQVPELDQSWRESGALPSLGVIMERQAQHCYQNLSRCLSAMSEITTEPQHQQTNGLMAHSNLDSSKASQQKKRLLMSFAKEQREFFVKSLVLLDWCRNADDIYKIKDVSEWQRKQRGAQMAAADAFLRMKANMVPAKMPNPNIDGAIELLSTSKASWIPHLQYIPPKRLTAKQLLDTLRDMNVILATRLILHEEIPRQMRDYTIANGRVTFTIPDECEVDFSVADEDAASPFYFIDIRLLYQPGSTALENQFRRQAEWRINYILGTKGLIGAYDFLHNFVLTHKINTLRSQAAEMIRRKWFDCLRIENLRRTFIVQYWTAMPGKKNWIEFGVSSGKENSSSVSASNSKISVRWFRQGIQVMDEPLAFDWKTLDLEQCVMTVIRKHTSWLLGNLQEGLARLVNGKCAFKCDLDFTESPMSSCALVLGLPSMRSPLTTTIELVTGQLVISPPSRATKDAETRLNSDASADRVKWLASLLCVAVQERAHKEAQLLGWKPASGMARQENLPTLFGGRSRFSVFVPNKAWGDKWALAVTFMLTGEKWWILQLEEKRDEKGQVIGKIISTARGISLQRDMGETLAISKTTLILVEEAAVTNVAFSALSMQLRDMMVPHQIQTLVSPTLGDKDHGRTPSSAMLIRFSPLMKEIGGKNWKPWAEEPIRVTHDGVAGDFEQAAPGIVKVRHDVRLVLRPGKLQSLREHFTTSRDREMSMNSAGGLALKLLTPFGESFAQQIQTRLLNVERLDRYAAMLKLQNFECVHLSSSRLSFAYSSAPRLTAELGFTNDNTLPVRLKLQPEGSNPHQRIRIMLERGFRAVAERGFTSILHILTMTLPLLQALERVEAVAPGKQNALVHPRSPTWFTLKFKNSLPTVDFHIRMKLRRDGNSTKALWLVQQARPTTGSEPPSAELVKALEELWQGQSDHWLGLGNSASADISGIGTLVDKLDEIVRRFEIDELVPKEVNGEEVPSEPMKKEASVKQPAAVPATVAQPSKPVITVKKEPDVITLD